MSTYAYQNFIINWPAGFRVAALYLVAAILTGTGLFLERWKESLCNYGRVVAAGGWAAAYYTTYAAHHIDRLRVIDNAVTAGMLLTVCALAFFAYAAWKKSAILTVAALAMAFYSTAINPMGSLGSFSGLLLSAIAMVFFVRFRWMHTGFASLLGAYLSYAYWQGFVHVDGGGEASRWFLTGYWLLFTTGVLVPQAKHDSGRSLASFATINNAAFFTLFNFDFSTLSWVPDVWRNALVFGGVLLVISAALARLPGYPKLLWQALLPQALALITWGLAVKLTGYHLFISLSIEALVLAAMWRRTRQETFRLFAWIAAVIAILGALRQTSLFGTPAPQAAFLIEGALLAAFSFLMRGASNLDERRDDVLSIEGMLGSLFALLIPTLGVLVDLPMEVAGLWMMGTGLLFWGLHMVFPSRTPLPELVWLAQPYAVVGACATIFTSPTPLQLGFTIALTGILFHLHGWAEERKRETTLPEASRIMEALFTLLALGALGLLIYREIDSANVRILTYGGLAILLHIYGSLSGRLPVVAIAPAYYLPVAALSALAWTDLLENSPSQAVLFASLALLLTHLVLVHLWDSLRFGKILREVLLVLLVLLWTGWLIAFIEPWWLILAWTGCALAFLPSRFRSFTHFACTAFLLVFGLLSATVHGPDEFLLRYLTVPVAFLVHLVKRVAHPDPDNPLGFTLIDGLGLLGVVSLTIITSQHTLDAFASNGLSICWALLGLFFFGLGLASKQRVYRLSGLVLLGASFAHVLAVDVWKLGTLLRILSFLTLSLVLLALGFVYNRWSDTLRRFL